MGQKILIGVIVGVMIAWAVSRQDKEKTAVSEAVLADAQMLMSQMEGFDENKIYIEDVVARAHEQAFSFVYKSGKVGRRFRPSEPASFNEDRYLATLFMHMRMIIQSDIDKLALPADQQKYKHIKRSVEELKKRMSIKDLNQL